MALLLGAFSFLLAFSARAQAPADPAPALSSSTAAAAAPAPTPVPERPDAQVDILSIGGYRFTLSMPLLVPFEKLLKNRAAEFRLLDVENVQVFFQGNRYRYQVPLERGGAHPAPSPAPARGQLLESEYGFFMLSDPDPALMEEFRSLASKPDSYRRPMVPQLALRRFTVLRAAAPEGTVNFLDIESPRPNAGQWRKTLGLVYRLWWRGRPIEAVFIYKSQGGLGRLASALEATRKNGAPSIAVSRGSLLARDASMTLEGRARYAALEELGLRVSALGLGEFRSFDAVQEYVKSRPEGIRFLSANLMAPGGEGKTVFPASVVIESGGLRVGFLGLTRTAYKKYMVSGALKSMTLEDPVRAALANIQSLRERSDAVVVISNLEPEENLRLSNNVRGIDVILADDDPNLPDGSNPVSGEREDGARLLYDPCLLTASEYSTAVNKLSLRLGPLRENGSRRMAVRQTHIVLDESVPDAPGYPEFDSEAFGVTVDTRPALLPAARRIFPEGSPNGPPGSPSLVSRDFWTLAASLVAARADAEAGLLPVLGISVRTSGDIKEGLVRDWFPFDDTLVTFEISGADLLELLRGVWGQTSAERQEHALPGTQLRLAAGGVGSDNKIHGVAIDPATIYRLAGSELLLANVEGHPALGRVRNVQRLGDLREAVIARLRAAADDHWPPERYAKIMLGAPLTDVGLWKVNFRDVSVNATNTKVYKNPDSYSTVPNSRIQGFDQQVVGLTVKADVEYYHNDFKWANTLNLEYSQARLNPPGAPSIVNTPNNRISFLTRATQAIGKFPIHWMARSFGPSLGLQYDGEVQKTAGLNRKQIYSFLPGVEFFNGDVIKSMELGGAIKRDRSRIPPNTQYGLHGRLVGALPIRKLMTLNIESYANYYVLTRTDTAQDLRLESDINLKLQIPIYKQLTIAPFFDFYVVELKTSPLVAYSAITGISLGFSRLWKPQYEKF